MGLDNKSGFDENRDAALLSRFQAGDDSAFDELMTVYYRPVLNLIYRFRGNSTARAAEDTAQEVFLHLYKALPRFEIRAKLFTYIYKVTMNQCLKEKRRRVKDIPVQISLDEPIETDSDRPLMRSIVDPQDSPLQTVECMEVNEELKKALLEIEEDMRMPLLLNRFYDMTYEDIAEVMGITSAAVRSRVHRARQFLLKRLNKAFNEGKEQRYE